MNMVRVPLSHGFPGVVAMDAAQGECHLVVFSIGGAYK